MVVLGHRFSSQTYIKYNRKYKRTIEDNLWFALDPSDSKVACSTQTLRRIKDAAAAATVFKRNLILYYYLDNLNLREIRDQTQVKGRKYTLCLLFVVLVV